MLKHGFKSSSQSSIKQKIPYKSCYSGIGRVKRIPNRQTIYNSHQIRKLKSGVIILPSKL